MPEIREFDLQKESDYVLGMMDLYQSDAEVSSFLKMKGLTNEQVDKVLLNIKQVGYKKRIRQAKRILVIGIVIMVVLGIVSFFLLNSSIYNANDSFIERVNARVYIRLPVYGFIFGVVQTVIGLSRFFTYSNKLKKI